MIGGPKRSLLYSYSVSDFRIQVEGFPGITTTVEQQTTMGCMNTTPALPNIHINEHGFPTEEGSTDQQGISTVSYNPRKSISVKRANEINAGLLNINYRAQSTTGKNNKNTRYSRQKPKRSRQSGRLTPGKMDFDTISISSIMSTNSCGNISPASLDLSAITDTHRHWNFPRWGHHKKCTFCGCQSHSPKGNNHHHHHQSGNTENILRKQNNQKLPSKAGNNGGCALAFANLLAMVRPIFRTSVLYL